MLCYLYLTIKRSSRFKKQTEGIVAAVEEHRWKNKGQNEQIQVILNKNETKSNSDLHSEVDRKPVKRKNAPVS